ncbi:MAG: hypothetical protein JWP94_1645 [Mucilaginibacter sp.]|nr:hypothetical protein [Mucilaginibacter sp.]
MDTNMSIVVSVIMPVYNAEKYLNEAIDSVLRQSFADFEFFIIDDHSTDKSRDIIRSYIDERIIFIEKPVNTGYTDSLNMAIERARGKYIARMDADDICMPDRFAKQFNFMEQHPAVAVCGTWYETMPAGQLVSHPAGHEDIKLRLLKNSAIGHPTAMMHKSVLTEHKLQYNRELEPAEDYDLWVRILPFGDLANIPEVLLKYREHTGQVSSKKVLKQLMNAGRIRVNLFNQMAGPLNTADLERAQKIFGVAEIKNNADLQDALNWLVATREINQRSGFFKHAGFSEYIDTAIVKVVRNYYLNRKRHNPGVLLDFAGAGAGIRKSLTLRDKAVLALKSLLWWRSV